MTTFSTLMVELPTTSNESTWPTTSCLLAVRRTVSMSSNRSDLPLGATGACLSSGAPETCANTGARQRNLLKVFGTSLVVTEKTENSRLRIFSVLRVLPEPSHFLRRSARLVLSNSVLSRVSSRNKKPSGWSSLPCQAFLVTAKVNWPWGRVA